MNDFGGYEWKTVYDKECHVNGMDNFSYEKLEMANKKLKRKLFLSIYFFCFILFCQSPNTMCKLAKSPSQMMFVINCPTSSINCLFLAN